MRVLTLQRVKESPDGTLGELLELSLTTIEEEDRNNEPNESRIPAGRYICRRARYNRGGYSTFEVCGVDGRSLIKFHKANTEEDVSGCIGVGLDFGRFLVDDEDGPGRRMKFGVTHSGVGFRQFMDALQDEHEFWLHVFDVNPETPEPEIELVDSGAPRLGRGLMEGSSDWHSIHP